MLKRIPEHIENGPDWVRTQPMVLATKVFHVGCSCHGPQLFVIVEDDTCELGAKVYVYRAKSIDDMITEGIPCNLFWRGVGPEESHDREHGIDNWYDFLLRKYKKQQTKNDELCPWIPIHDKSFELYDLEMRVRKNPKK